MDFKYEPRSRKSKFLWTTARRMFDSIRASEVRQSVTNNPDYSCGNAYIKRVGKLIYCLFYKNLYPISFQSS